MKEVKSNNSAQGEVRIMVSIKHDIKVRLVNTRTIMVTIKNRLPFTSVYAPQCGCSTEEKDFFYDT